MPPEADGYSRRHSLAKPSVRRKRPAGKYNFGVGRIFLMAIALQAGVASAETAVLECISSVYNGGATFFQFRMTAVPGWKISKASLLLHATADSPPATVQAGLVKAPWNEFDPSVIPVAGKARKYEATVLRDGWIRIEIDAAEARQIKHGLFVVVPGKGKVKPLHLRDSLQFSPYLLLEGTPKD